MRNIPRQAQVNKSWFFSRFIFRHLQASLFALGTLKRTWLASFVTICVIAVSLVLPLILFVGLKNIQTLTGYWKYDTQISLFLEHNLDQARIDDLRREISRKPNVMHVEYISPAQGLAELGKTAGFTQVVEQLPENPLPTVLEVYPTNLLNHSAMIESLVADLSQYPEVEASQLDMQWLLRLSEILNLAQRAAWALALLLSISVLLIVSNTIRLATYNRRHEIEVLKLIGATNGFIRRPFLYTGLFYGVFGACFAWFLVFLLRMWLLIPVQNLAALYDSDFVLQGLGFTHGCSLLIFAAILGAMGASFAVSRHIARIEPI